MASSKEDEVAVYKLQPRKNPGTEPHQPDQIVDKLPASKNHEGSSLSLGVMVHKDPLLEPYNEIVHSSAEISSNVSDRASKTPDTIISPLRSCSEGTSPLIREKVSEDGYNWRKYGQKLVKGNEFIRSYYKCTHPNCQAKKQLERSHGKQIIDTVYFGQHDHPKPVNSHPSGVFVAPISEERQNEVYSATAKEKSSDAHGEKPKPTELANSDNGLQLSVVHCSDVRDAPPPSDRIRDDADRDDTSGSKRRKKDSCNDEASPANNKPTGDYRVVIQTRTLFDVVNDGYRWRKYGQKSVKGSPYPRSYYRCSSTGCLVKKHVERASHDPKYLITTYEGQHDHEMPPGRTVTHNPARNNADSESDAHGVAKNGGRGSIIDGDGTVCPNPTIQGTSPESKSTEPLNGKSSVESEMTGTLTRGLNGTKGEEAISQVESGTTTAEKKSTASLDPVVCTESNFEKKMQTPNAESVQS